MVEIKKALVVVLILSSFFFSPFKGPWLKRIFCFWRRGEQLTERILTRVLMDRVGLGIEKMHCAMNPWTTGKRHVWLSFSTFTYFFQLATVYYDGNYFCFCHRKSFMTVFKGLMNEIILLLFHWIVSCLLDAE